jgi:hypothetical protein
MASFKGAAVAVLMLPYKPDWKVALALAQVAPRCQARCRRSKLPYRGPAMRSKAVCRVHGGKGGGPVGVRNGNYRTGRFSQEAKAERQRQRSLVRELRRFVRLLGTLGGKSNVGKCPKGTCLAVLQKYRWLVELRDGDTLAAGSQACRRSAVRERLGVDLLRLDGSPLLPAVLGSPLVDGIAVGSLISRLPCLDGLAVSFSELAVALASGFPAFFVSRVFPPSTHRSTLDHVMAPRVCSRR